MPIMETQKGKMKNILIVDDERDLCTLVGYHMRGAGWKASYALNGILAIEMAKRTLPDLIILDIILPDIDGFEVFQQIKRNVQTKHIPIIMLTCLTDEKSRRKGLEMGALNYVTKPFSPKELVEKVKGVLESGSVGDYINSISLLATRKINEPYPSHGNISKTPEEDMQKAILNARALLRDEEGVEISHFRELP